MNVLLILPIVIPLLTAIASILAWHWRRVQRGLSLVGAIGLFVAGVALLASVSRDGIQAAQMGNWPAPFGITLVADLLSAIMVVLAALVGLAVAIYSLASVDPERETFGYYPLLHALLIGVNGAFLTGDMFNLYVWFEVMLMASFVLLALGGERRQLEGAFKYVTLNLMASALFLAAVGVLYGVAGTLNMADLSQRLRYLAQPGLVTTLAVLFLLAFGIKSAVFPLFFWLPASYHTPPVAVSAIFGGLLTKVGVYSLVRVFTLIFRDDVTYTHHLILIIAGFTMITGILGAVAQTDFRRILSFNLISHIGYMLMGLGLFTPLALAGSIFYIIHHIIVKTNLFLISGLVQWLGGSYSLKKLSGLYRDYPGIALLFLVPALSLAGIPPLSGFWPKVALLRAGLREAEYLIVAAALVASLLTLLSMTRVWVKAFWRNDPTDGSSKVSPSFSFDAWFLRLLPVTSLAILTIVIGLMAEPILDLSLRTSEQLMNPSGYIRSVMEVIEQTQLPTLPPE
jgi:multicomponent Na+:H+ antiporter subunit D